jgi:hypothetical protein
MTRKTKTWAACAASALALAGVAPAAQGQTASEQGYDESGVLAGVDQGGGGPNSVSTSGGEGGSLPFTGLDLIVLFAGALLLLALGLGLRAVARAR